MARAEIPDEIDGAYRHSATKTDNYLTCERKFGWQYIAKLPRVEHASAALGSRCHDMLEAYLKGTPPDFGVVVNGNRIAEIIAPGLHYLPAPKTPGLEVEGYFRWRSPAGHLFIGYKDVRVAAHVAGSGIARVIDHKTTSGLQWAKTPEDLRGDPQAVIYAADEFARDSFLEAVDLEWIYYQTRGANRSKRTHLRVLRDDGDFSRAVESIDLVATDIARHNTITASLSTAEKHAYVLTMRPNARACEKFGGCAFVSHCNLSPGERIRSMANQSSKGTVDLLAELEARKAPPAEPAKAPPVADALAWLFAPKKDETKERPTFVMPPLPTSPVTLQASVTQIEQRIAAEQDVPHAKGDMARAAYGGRETHPDDPINPPEAQRAPTPEERTAADAAAKAEKAGPPKDGARIRRTKEEIAAGMTVEQAKAARAAIQQAGHAVSALADIAVQSGAITLADADRANADMVALDREVEAAQKAIAESGEMPSHPEKLLGVHIEPPADPMAELSRLGQELQPAHYYTAPATIPAPPPAVNLDNLLALKPGDRVNVKIGADGKVERFEAERTEPAAWTLYVDCRPLDERVLRATDLILEAQHDIEEDEKVPDYRLVGFGKGPGMLSVIVADLAKRAGADLFLDTSTPEGSIVKERLIAAASRVVMGVR